jgi:serine/threonine protein kinase
VLHDQYTIVRLLARGGFGSVYEPRDIVLHEEVALKELIPVLVGDEPTLMRLLAESKATIRLTHDRIVLTHNAIRHDEHYYIVIKYMAGGSLERRLQDYGWLAAEEAVQVVTEVCEGLGLCPPAWRRPLRPRAGQHSVRGGLGCLPRPRQTVCGRRT